MRGVDSAMYKAHAWDGLVSIRVGGKPEIPIGRPLQEHVLGLHEDLVAVFQPCKRGLFSVTVFEAWR